MLDSRRGIYVIPVGPNDLTAPARATRPSGPRLTRIPQEACAAAPGEGGSDARPIAARSDVQFGHRVAASGIVIAQNGQAFVFGVAGGGCRYSRLTARTRRNTAR